MILEKQFKEKLLSQLNTINSNWIDGDSEQRNGSKVDLVNHRLKIVIELKDDTKHKINLPNKPGVFVENDQDLTVMNARLNDDIRSANKKFKNYPDYKTILLFRTEFFIADVFRYALEGLHTYSLPRDKDEKLKYVGRKTKYSPFIRKEIGCFIVWTDDRYYISNELARPQRVLEKEEIEKLFNLKFKNVNQI